MRLSTERQAQGQGKQAAEMNAMGHRVIEVKDLIMQRERRLESQMQGMCSEIQTIGVTLREIQPQTESMVTMGSTREIKDQPLNLL